MPGTCVVGLQWGDEAKGKIVDLLSEEHQVVVRYNGGANAGHTIVRDGKTFKLSLLPSGILSGHMQAVVGNGVVIYPPKALDEIETLRRAGIAIGENLALSSNAHVIFPYHLEEERLHEGGAGSIGTTGRGIGPCYQDKVSRHNGIRLGDLIDSAFLRERLEAIVPRKNVVLKALGDAAGLTPRLFDVTELVDEYSRYGDHLKRYVADTSRLLHDALKAGKNLLFEAAQGSLLDIDFGTYPYVTSSSSLPSGIWVGCGVPTKHLRRTIGVVKAYSTRVGRGPFPTELDDGPTGIGERIRRIGREYGTVTGRPRRVGWLDAVALRYTTELAGADELSIMLLDVLSGLPELSICTAYELDGRRLDHFPSDARILARCRPIFETLPGWSEDISTARTPADLPHATRGYIDRIGELLGVRPTIASVGPDRVQTIRL